MWESAGSPHTASRVQFPFVGKDREQPSINTAAVRDRVVGEHEDVLPECIARPEGLHRSEVVLPACRGVVRCVPHRAASQWRPARSRGACTTLDVAAVTRDRQQRRSSRRASFSSSAFDYAFGHRGLTWPRFCNRCARCSGVNARTVSPLYLTAADEFVRAMSKLVIGHGRCCRSSSVPIWNVATVAPPLIPHLPGCSMSRKRSPATVGADAPAESHASRRSVSLRFCSRAS